MEKNYSHKKSELQKVLSTLRQCINNGNYTVKTEGPRQINRNFIDNYNLNDAKIKDILLNINVDEFCYTTISRDAYHAGNILYVFQPIVKLYNPDDVAERIQMYVKFDIVNKKKDKQSIIISFHEAQWPERYCFR